MIEKMVPQIVQRLFLTKYMLFDAIQLTLQFQDRLHNSVHGLHQLSNGLLRCLVYLLAFNSTFQDLVKTDAHICNDLLLTLLKKS